MLQIKPYQPEHSAQCIELFNSNLPVYFAESEKSGFCEFLKDIPDNTHFFVMMLQDKLIACGGYEIHQNCAGLCWGMVHRQYHGQSLGTQLLRYRLEQLLQSHHCERVVIDTSQHTQGFYRKYGFEVTDVIRHGYGENLHTVYMRYQRQAGTGTTTEKAKKQE